MLKEKIILCGCGGHAKSVLDAIESGDKYEVIGFVDRSENMNWEYRGYRVLGTDNDLQKLYHEGIHNAFVCVGYLGKGDIRRKLYIRLKEIGFTLPEIIDPTAVIAKDVKIGEGSFLGKRVVVNSNAEVGKMVILNTSAIIEHDCKIKNFCHIAVAAVICGGCKIGESAFVGANATIIQSIEVGENVIIGAGSIVKRDIKEGVFINSFSK